MLAPWKKRHDQLSTLKSRDITLPTKVHLFKAMVFSVVTYGCESWTIKKAEHRRIDALELWCWRRLLRVPWTAGKANQSILKEISPEYLLEVLMLKLKLQYFGHLMWRANSLEKTLMLRKIEGRRGREWQRMKWLDGNHRFDGHEFEQALGVGDGQGSLACYSSWDCQESDTTEWLNWTELGDSEGQWSLACCSPWDCKELANDLAHEQWQQQGKHCRVWMVWHVLMSP